MIWCENEGCARQAAWLLSTVLRAFEHSLREFSLTPEQKTAPCEAWIWEPFEEPEDSALPIIAGRAAWLIDHGEPPSTKLAADPRLMIPLCALRLGKEFQPVDLESDKASTDAKKVVPDLRLALGTTEDDKRKPKEIIDEFLKYACDLTFLHEVLAVSSVGPCAVFSSAVLLRMRSSIW